MEIINKGLRYLAAVLCMMLIGMVQSVAFDPGIKAALLKEGLEKFEVLQRSNALNTSRGESSGNSYVLSLEGKYIEEKLSGTAVTLLSASELDLLDGELRRMNSSTAAKRENAAVYVLVFNSWWVKLARLIPEDVSIKSLFSTTEYGAEEKKLNEVTGDFYKELGNLDLSQKLQIGMAEKRIGYVLGRVAFQKDAEKAREYFVNDISASGFTEQQDRLLEATVSQVAKMQGAGHYDRVSARLKVLGEGLEKALGTTGETFEKEREVLKNMSPRLVNKWKVELNDGTGVRTILESGEDEGTISYNYDAKTNKWTASVELGQLQEQRQGDRKEIEATLKKIINDKISSQTLLQGGNNNVDIAVPVATEDGGEFKFGDGLNWIEYGAAITDALVSIYDQGSIPEAIWKKGDPKYENYPFHAPSTVAGVADGVVDNATASLQLMKFGGELLTDPKIAAGIWESVKEISPETLKASFGDAVQKGKNLLTYPPTAETYHAAGKLSVDISGAALSGGALASTKAVNEAVKGTGDAIKRMIADSREKIKKFFDTDDFRKILDDRLSKYKGLLSKEEWTKRYETLFENRKIGKLTEEQFELLEGGTKPRRSVKTSDGKRFFDNVLDNVAREVKSGPVTLSQYREQILKDIEILKGNLTAGQIKKIEWHCFDELDPKVRELIKEQGVNENSFQIIKY